ncbi:odorant receptor 67c-like [Vespula maculifrons]|uniref:Odorant receptor 67c-like n=1 Tax=Vespula maculifrons TaxID=7453 RepID=A0ABD2ASR0_VESMC
MVLLRIKPNQMLRLLNLTGNFTSTWPGSQKAGRFEMVLRDVGWILGMLNAFLILLALFYADYYYINGKDVVTLMKPLCETATLIDVILALILCRFKRTSLQKLMEEVEEFIKNCNTEEEAIMQKYIDHSTISTTMAASNVAAAIAFSFTPFFTENDVPGDAMFPFDLKSLFVKIPIYILDMILLFQTALCVCVDFMIAMLMWYSATKLEILGLKLENAADKYKLIDCAKEHQKILKQHEPINVELQFICMMIASYQRLYVTALPADDLKEMSMKLATSAYSSKWFEDSSKMAIDVHIIILRSQKPILISMGGLLPNLTLEYYANILEEEEFKTMIKISAERAILFLKASVILTACWPPSPKATRSHIILFELSWYVLFANALFLLFPLINAIYENRTNSIVMTKSICLFCAVAQITFKMILCRLERSRFQSLLFDLEKSCKIETSQEKVVFERYINKCKYIHLLYTSLCYLTAIIVICSPLYTYQRFPTNAKYPFSVDHSPIREIIFLHQTLVGLQVSAGMCIDCQLAALLWYVGAKFEVLSKNIREFKKVKELNACLKKHQEILRYAAETKDVILHLILTTTLTTTMGIIFAGLNIVDQQSTAVKIQYVFIVCVASTELLISAWPADNLINTSSNISWDVYNSNWLKTNPCVRRNLVQCIMRSQKFETIHVGKLKMPFCLQYYASFLTSSFSYFTTLRAVLGKE